jgi:serine/threonine protein kinase
LSDLEEDDANSSDNGDGTPTYNSFAYRKKEKRRMSRQKTIDNQGEMASLSIIELMHQIVSEPPPRLGSQFAEEPREFVDACLTKDPDERHTPRTLLARLPLLSHPGKVAYCIISRNIDGWMMLEIRILIWQDGRARFDS